jgi:hypothetical protein
VHPEHLLYRPVDHGLTVIDWCCAVIDGTNEPVPLVSVAWEPHYPPEIRRKRPEPSTDIYMAAKAMVYAAAGKMPKGFGGLLDWCMADSPKSRPTDAWEVQDQWKARAEQEYGPAKFVALEVPKQ